MSKNLLTVSLSPHRLGRMTVRSMHTEILIALAPALLTGLYYFKQKALWTVLITTVTAVAVEWLAARITKRTSHLGDLNAVLIGLLAGMIMAPGSPWWLAVFISVVAIVLGKLVFGGLGNFPMNPVLIAWAALAISWPEHMNAFFDPQPLFGKAGAWTAAQPTLAALRADLSGLEDVNLWNLWLGRHVSAVGAGGTLALLVGGLYLVFRRIVPWQIPLGVIVGAAGMALFASYVDPKVAQLELEGFRPHWNLVMIHLGSGGLMLAAFFLAPEPVSSPVTPWGALLYGLLIGIMTEIVRFWGAHVDGIFYAVLIMNAATPLFDRIRPRVIGKVMNSA